MQELTTVDRTQAAVFTHAAIRQLRSAVCETVLTGTEEAVEDLAEVDYLISDLTGLALSNVEDSIDLYGLSQDWMGFRQNIHRLKSRHVLHLDLIERASMWGQSGQLNFLLDTVRNEYLAIKSALRIAYRQRGMMLCASDWQSPIYSCSFSIGMNRLTHGIREHSWDYKRDGHLDALAYEEAFIAEYAAHLGSNQVKAYLANSGMAAFTTVLHWLAQEQSFGESALLLLPMYFENLHLTQAFFSKSVQMQSPAQEELLSYLRTECPSVVFLDAVTNCGDVMSHDFETLLHWAAEEAEHKLAIVIDTTCMPSAVLPSRLLKGLPENVLVILVESLAKHHQFGMDTVTGGIVVAHMEEALQESFRKTRARLGTNIADASVGSLPKPSRLRLTKRMQRHSRNTRMLAEALESQAVRQEGAIESVSWLNEGTKAAPWFKGTCLTLRLRRTFRSIDCYREFESIVLELANARTHPIAFSTSFGFDVSRLYVTAPATRFEEPFLRISIGTETKSQVDCLCEILTTASIDLARRTLLEHKGSPIKRSESPELKKSQVTDAPAIIEKPDMYKSVFLGEEALKKYLSPANYATTPLVEVPPDLNPFKNDGVRLLAKMMPLVPLMNIKSVPAFSMLSKAAERGDLNGVEKIIESSSSNTVLSLSVIGRLFGIDTTCALVDHSIAPSLVRMLRLFGIEIFMHPGPGHELYGRMSPRSERAVACGQQAGWFNPGQYSNPDNPEGFALWLAPDLWSQTQGRLSVLSCGLGTCGTMVGVSRGLQERNPNIQVVACCPKAGDAVPGPRERSQLSDVSFSWQEVANANVELTAEESFAASIKLLRRGILGGPSSGMNYAGVLQYLEQIKSAGLLEETVRAKGELWCVFLCCDSPLPHVDEYYDALGEQYFPAVHAVSEEDQLILQHDAH